MARIKTHKDTLHGIATSTADGERRRLYFLEAIAEILLDILAELREGQDEMGV